MNQEQIPQELKLYADKDKQTELKRIDLGRLAVGQQTEVVVYLANESKKWNITNLKLNEEDEECSIKFPEFLMPGEVAPVTIKFHPSLARREPLDMKHLFSGELWIG